MTPTQTVKQYGELAVAQGRSVAERAKTPLLAAVGAGDLAVERARTAVQQFRTRATSSIAALPGEAQVQADLAVKEARTRATDAAGNARVAAQQLVTAVRPDHLRSTVTGLVDTVRAQALTTVEHLAEHGAEVVDDLRRQPGLRRVVRRGEHAVDTVEGSVDKAVEKTAGAVRNTANKATSVAQKTAARSTKVANTTEAKVDNAAKATKSTAEDAVKPASKPTTTPAKKSSPAARKSPAKATSATVTRARTAKPANPTAVPSKKS